MPTLSAPAPKTFTTVEQGTYTGTVMKIEVEDHTTEPDKFGKKGFFTLVFRWVLEGVEDEDGGEISIPQYVKLTTGDRPITTGTRAGRLPWLTEITRAFGQPDLQPGDPVDTDMWLGKRARLGILQQVQSDGTFKNAINSVNPAKARTAGQAAARVAARPAPAPAPADDDDIAF